jgi:hypothetical protein
MGAADFCFAHRIAWLTTDVLAARAFHRRKLGHAHDPFAEMDNMTSRTTQKVVRFPSAFALPGFDAPQPAGDYLVDHDEEEIGGHSTLAWRRVASFIHLPAVSAAGMTKQMVPIEPAWLEAALGLDRT